MKYRTSVYASFLSPFFQSKEMESSAGLAVEIIILIYIFCGFGVMCDKYLIPTIESIKEKYKISERLAGSTILALGSSISLIASNMNAVLRNQKQEFEMGLTAIIGAAIFEFTIGFAIGCFLLKKNYKLSYFSIASDLIMYFVVVMILFFFLKNKSLSLIQSISLVVLWIFYMIYLILSSAENSQEYTLVLLEESNSEKEQICNNQHYKEIKEKFDTVDQGNDEEFNISKIEKQIISSRKKYLSDYSTNISNLHNVDIKENYIEIDTKKSMIPPEIVPTNHVDEICPLIHKEFSYFDNKSCHAYLKEQKYFLDKIEECRHQYINNVLKKLETSQSLVKTFVKLFLKATAKPWEIILNLFTPDSTDGLFLLIKFFVPLFFIWNLSEIELFLLEKIMSRLKLPPSFLGLTIMSWGNNAPDMFNVASAMSRGLVDLAMNAAIASEMHNILLGLGLPWLVYNCTIGKPIIFEMTSLYAFTILFFAGFILCFIIVLKLNRNRFDKKLAAFLITVYGVFFSIIFCFSFNVEVN